MYLPSIWNSALLLISHLRSRLCQNSRLTGSYVTDRRLEKLPAECRGRTEFPSAIRPREMYFEAPRGKGSKGDLVIMALAQEIAVNQRRGHPPGADSGRPVDLVHLARQTLGNRSLEREVLGLFHTQSEIYLQRLKDAGKDKDWADAAHTIKGSARGIGAWSVANSAEAAEALRGKTRKTGALEALRELERSIGEANAYIESLLAESGSGEAGAEA